MFCGNCGAKLRDDDRFCPKCGAKTRLVRQMEQIPEETAVPASSSSSVESASNAGAKPRKTVRLKSVPTGQVQNDSKPEQAGPVKTEPEPAAPVNREPVKEERQEKPPQQSAEPAGASESEPVYHAPEPEQKDTADGGSIRCGNCGATLKAGTKFCPECGAAIGVQQHETPQFENKKDNKIHSLKIVMKKPSAATNPCIVVTVVPGNISGKIRGGEVLDFSLPRGSYIINFKCAFRKATININLAKDSIIDLEWNMLLGTIEPTLRSHSSSGAENNNSTTQGPSSSEQNHENNSELVPVTLNRHGGILAILCFIGALLALILRVFAKYIFGYFPSLWLYWIPVALGIIGIRLLLTRKKKAYAAKCPYCGQDFYFPVNSLNCQCPKCNKLVILKDGKFEIVNS